MDKRLRQLTQWLHQQPGLASARPAPVSGDASFRRYFRANTDQGDTVIIMDAPPDREDCTAFVHLADHWHRQGVSVPAILAQDQRQGFLLLEDFGDTLFLDALDEDSADLLYTGAIAELMRIQQVSESPGYPLPLYDTALLDREMALFPDWLLTGFLELDLSSSELSLLDTTFAFLRESALAQPEVTVHRDYHSRNLLVRPGQATPGVIDFQDAVRGPVTYDLVSLLKDCYIRWPEHRLGQWLEQCRQLGLEAGVHHADSATFRQWFELMGMQRHLKAAGIFARLSARDGKDRYLADIPRTVGYLAEASARQGALRHFHQWLREVVIPRIEARIGPVPHAEATRS